MTPPGRFGALARDGSAVEAFIEKPAGDGGTINGGFLRAIAQKVLESASPAMRRPGRLNRCSPWPATVN